MDEVKTHVEKTKNPRPEGGFFPLVNGEKTMGGNRVDHLFPFGAPADTAEFLEDPFINIVGRERRP